MTDPPYGLGFMGKKWDALPPGDKFAAEALRVLKPGAHLVAFGGTRTYHRLVVALEDAGFEIRDQLQWLYGSGFPKSLDISKAIDKAAGAEREVTGKRNRDTNWRGVEDPDSARYDPVAANDEGGENRLQIPALPRMVPVTAPATDAARRWQGWGTALKPAHEPIVLARKPLSERTVAANVERWGTGGLNVDGGRLPHSSESDLAVSKAKNPGRDDTVTSGVYGKNRPQQTVNEAGRWPPNVALDEEAAAMVDEQSGETSFNPAGEFGRAKRNAGSIYGGGDGLPHEGQPVRGFGDRGGASRFMYVAKASRKERNAGLGDEFEERRVHPPSGDNRAWDIPGSHSTPRKNDHPTVKPIALMRWLVRLVTPPGGLVVDPFVGSGTTGIAALLEGFDFVGIDQDPHYIDIARARIEHSQTAAG